MGAAADIEPAPPEGVRGRIAALLGAERSELPALAWSFTYFFCLLCAYYLIRPMRDEMVVRFGADRIQWIYSMVFVIMLAVTPAYGWLVARWPRRQFLPIVYLFFITCLGAFWLLFHYNAALAAAVGADAAAFGRGSAAALAIWITVFNLFVVSVFWSFMSDIYEPAQSRRLFATIYTGGTMGAIVGPIIARRLATTVEVDVLLLISALFLSLCLVCIGNLVPWARARELARSGRTREEPIGGSVIAGARLIFQQPILRRLALLMLLGVAVGSVLYNRQIHLQAQVEESAARLAFFANLDLWINLLALAFQLGVTRFLLTRLGAGWLLMVPAVVVIVGFGLIYGHPTAIMVAIVQVATRGLSFGMLSPARETLYTRVDREARYKAKNFIDTAVWRGGDLITQWSLVGLIGLGLATPALALIGIGLAVVWLLIALSIRLWEQRQDRTGRQML